MLTFESESKNGDYSLTMPKHFGIKAIVAGVAVTAMCAGLVINVPGISPLEVEAAETDEVSPVKAINIQTVTVPNPVIEGPGQSSGVVVVDQEAVLVEIVPAETEGGPLSSNEDIAESLASVEDSENPEMQAIREQAADEAILAKYSYALYDTGGVRTDFTPYLLRVAEEACAEQGIAPELLIAQMMTESEGHANARSKYSTATGLGQILKGTGKYIYESLLGNGAGTYSHSMAYDPELNIRMSAAYLGQLKRERGSMYRAIQSYRGKNDISGYTGKMQYWLSKAGLNLNNYM